MQKHSRNQVDIEYRFPFGWKEIEGMHPMDIRFIAVIASLLFLGWSSAASGQTIRFCPEENAPIAFDSATGGYEEGASFDPLICAEEPCLEILGNLFEPWSRSRRLRPSSPPWLPGGSGAMR
jgi:hypothetical protein